MTKDLITDERFIHDWRTLDLESLDIIMCAGNSGMSRRIQKFQRLTGAPEEAAIFSHVAGVLKFEAPLGIPIKKFEGMYSKSGLFVEESTTLNKWAGKSGVQVNPFEEWLENYDGMVGVRHLGFDRYAGFYMTERNSWNVHKDEPYESGIPGYTELFLCGLRLHRYVRRIPIPCFQNYVPRFTKKPHCTELQANRMNEHQVWDSQTTIFPNRMPPWVWLNVIDDKLAIPISDLIWIK